MNRVKDFVNRSPLLRRRRTKKYTNTIVSRYSTNIPKIERVIYPSGNIITIYYLPTGVVDKMFLNDYELI